MTKLDGEDFYPLNLARLPAGWTCAMVGDVALDVRSGFASGIHNANGLGIVHLRPMNIDRDGRLVLNEVKSVAPDNPLRVAQGDVLFNNTNSPELIGKTAVITQRGDWGYSNHMTRLRFPEGVDSRFIAYQLHFLWMSRYFRHRCVNHVNQASISGKALAETVPLVLAPLLEQRRIVAEIEKQFTRLDAGVEALSRLQVHLKRYRASVLKAACEGQLVPTEAELARREGRDYEPADKLLARILNERRSKWEAEQLAKMKVAGKTPKDDSWKAKYEEPPTPHSASLPTLPDGWIWASPSQIAAHESWSFGIGPFGSNLKVNDYRAEGVPLVFVRNIRTGHFGGANQKCVSPDKAEELRAHAVIGGDVLITKMGEPPGDACVYPFSEPPGIITADCIKLRLHPALPSPSYVVACITSQPVRRQILGVTQGVAQQKVSLGRFQTIAIPVAPPAEQIRIAEAVEDKLSLLDAVAAGVARSLVRANRLRQSVLKNAFEGKLVAQNPADEPATALLERIRSTRAQQDDAAEPRRKTRSRAVMRLAEGA